MRIGIAGAGGIALACAAWLARQGHAVTLWAPRGNGGSPERSLVACGALETSVRLHMAGDAEALAAACDLLILAVPANAHRAVAEALAPHLRDGMTLFVSATASLSALHLFECARRHGRDVTVAASGTTVLTARRESPERVRILTRRGRLGLSTLPQARWADAAAMLENLFGALFSEDANLLASTLSNINPVAHAPLALFNWTRIERAEHWPQYHYMTPAVAHVIEAIDRERQAVAAGYGLAVPAIEAHFARSFGATAPDLAGIAAQLHAARGGPPGPVDTGTRFLHEDVPFGLVFTAALGRLVSVPTPATETIINASSLIAGCDFASANDLIGPLDLARETRAGLLNRVS